MKIKKGFTLLEVIVVVIIISLLAGLAVPRFYRTVEYSRSVEALSMMGVTRQGIERCYLMTSGNYNSCNTFQSIGVEDPNNDPAAHFSYTIDIGGGATLYSITATRNSLDGGNVGDTIKLEQTTTGAQYSGTGAFSRIK